MPLELLPLFSIALTILVAIGAVAAFRGNAHRSTNEIQRSTIEALQAQNEAQEKQIGALEKKVEHLEQNIDTMLAALRQKGVTITIEGDLVTIDDRRRATSASKITRHRPPQKKEDTT